MVLLLLAVVAVVAAVAAWVLHRRSAAEVHSVEHYRHALDTLQAVQDRASSGSVRLVGPRSGPAPEGGEVLSQPGPPRGTDRPRVFEDGPGGSYTPPGAGPVRRGPGVAPRPAAWSASWGGRHRRDRAMAAMSRSPRRLGGPLLVGAAAALLLVVVIVVVAHGSRSPGSAASGTHAGTPTTGVTRSSSSHHPATGSSTRSPSHTGGATKTTVPTSYTAVSSSANAATYTPPVASFTVDVAAGSGPCWVQASSPSTGKTVFAGTVPAGQQQSINGAGTLTVLLGAPTEATVTLDGTPVTLPNGYRAPFTLTFAPASG